MKIREMMMQHLKPDEQNANLGTRRGRELLKRSLAELGAGRSILVDKEGQIIAGNKTFEAAQEAGIKVRIIPAGRDELVAVQRDDLDLDDPTGEARRLAYLDNRVSEIDLVWDAEQLAEDVEAGMDLDSLGFMEAELRLLLEGAGIEEDILIDPGEQLEEVDELLEKWGVELGQTWALGAHRLTCGDTIGEGIVSRLFSGERATLCFTSPPYWVGKEYEMQDSEEEISKFIQQVSKVMVEATSPDESRIVINTGTGFTTAFDKKSKRHVLLLIDQWANALRSMDWNLRHIRHWLKEGQLMSTSPKSDLIDQHCEFIGAFEHDEGKHLKFEDVVSEDDVKLLMVFYNKQGNIRGQERTGETWALRSYWDDLKGKSGAHGAAFPVELPVRHLMLYTKKNELVFEPFCGSGTTIIACEIMKRRCFAVEISPEYVAATLERWSILTGKSPVLV